MNTNQPACKGVASQFATHTGSRLRIRGECERCETETNWIVILRDGGEVFWCGCGSSPEPIAATYTIDRDRNGNRIVRVTVPGNRPFTIQTNGNLPQTHRDGICPATAGEVNAYVRELGTVRQRELLGV